MSWSWSCPAAPSIPGPSCPFVSGRTTAHVHPIPHRRLVMFDGPKKVTYVTYVYRTSDDGRAGTSVRLAGEYLRSSALAAGKGKKASQRKIREAFSGTYGDGHGACMGFWGGWWAVSKYGHVCMYGNYGKGVRGQDEGKTRTPARQEE